MADQTVMDKVLAQLQANELVNMPASAAEKFFDSIGLMRGSMAPVYRGGFGFAVGGALMFAIRPSFFFHPDGSPKPWGVGYRGDPADATMIPWWMVSAGLGAYCGLFI
jgi:hypothetical protein